MDLHDLLKQEIRETNSRVVRAAEDLTDEQVAWQPGGTIPPIGFHIWHSARWADNDQATISGDEQVWHIGGYAERWRLIGAALGEADTGTGMSDDQSAGLVLPEKLTLLDYVAAVFGRQGVVLNDLTPDQMLSRITAVDGRDYPVQGLLLAHLNHVNRHLGMIEALKGLQGLRGTATR
jgi:hypothetical protein